MDKIYKGEYKITSPFGERNLDGDKRFHKGEDHVGISNKYVVAPTSGKIISSTIITNKNIPTWEWGNYVKMDDLNGFYLFFCHLASRSVEVGQTINEGQIIGLEGNTGYSKGSHCHFEVRRKSDGISINPREYFKILGEWETKHFRKLVKDKYKFDDSTMLFLDGHPYPKMLYEKLSSK